MGITRFVVCWLIEEVCQHLTSVFAHLESTRLFSVHTLSRFKAQFQRLVRHELQVEDVMVFVLKDMRNLAGAGINGALMVIDHLKSLSVVELVDVARGTDLGLGCDVSTGLSIVEAAFERFVNKRLSGVALRRENCACQHARDRIETERIVGFKRK